MLQRRQFLTAATFAADPRIGFAGRTPGAFLTIRGHLRRYTDEKEGGYQFSEDEFMSLEQSTITTSTTWTERARFEGPLMSDVLKHVGASGSRLDVVALDNYSVSIPMSDLATYGVILAHSRGGKRMTARDFGPTWVMYPRDRYPDKLNTPLAQSKFVWQVRRVTVAE
jgi:hypothetical protein